jgi:potassium/chloride transporter 9
MGVIGSAKLLQALARDNLLPGFRVFGQGTKGHDEPTYAIMVTYLVAQLTMLCNINQIASFVTMTYLMTFLVTNLACFLLTISAAPNFRPSFHYFNVWTAGFGALVSGISMFFVDGFYASGSITILVLLFILIHYTTPPKSWGDVSQSLIYHQVRKYLLRLRQEHVKFWRPQILLFINNPRHQYELIQFCNCLKKGALFVLGHVIVSNDFGSAVPEARRQQAAWTKFIDVSKIKAFVSLAISPGVEWGTRNIVLGAGLGGMRPNIVIMGAYNLREFRDARPLIDVPPMQGAYTQPVHEPREQPVHKGLDQKSEELEGGKIRALLPTDSCRTEGAVGVQSYVTILEDLLLRLQINVAIARGFKNLEFPQLDMNHRKKYIDLWPIQMAAEIPAEGAEQQNILTTNFDTYTLILQLGCILNTVPAWKKTFALRVAVFVEYESDVEEERGRVKALLNNLRIRAEILVFWLASGDLKTYQTIINGSTNPAGKAAEKQVDEILHDEDWWRNVQDLRGRRKKLSAVEELSEVQNLLSGTPTWPHASFQHGRRGSPIRRFEGLKKMIRKSKRHRSSSRLRGVGVQLGMRTHHLHDDVINCHVSHASTSEDSGSSDSGSDGEDADGSQSISDRASAASENDIDGIDDLDDFEESAETPKNLNTRPASKAARRYSDGETMTSELRVKNPVSKGMGPKLPGTADGKTTPIESSANIPIGKAINQLSRPPPLSRQASAGRFTSRPVPKTRVASEDGPGPSIMFSDTSSPAKENPHQSSAPVPATGFPFPQNMPLSFNDLPCRAQHLILNELMLQHSRDTAVLFTTLPSPMEGTCKREEDCVRYLSDLEVLCANLPPVLLVHSNSMTVTMNL